MSRSSMVAFRSSIFRFTCLFSQRRYLSRKFRLTVFEDLELHSGLLFFGEAQLLLVVALLSAEHWEI